LELKQPPLAFYFAVIAAVAFFLFGLFLIPGTIPITPASDIWVAHLATQQVFHDLDPGGFFWRRDHLAGTVGFTNPQARPTHPLGLLFWILPPLWAMGPTLFLALLVLAFGMWSVGRTLGMDRLSALVLALGTLCNVKLIFSLYAGWLPPLLTWAAAPWVVAAWLQFKRAPDLRRALLLALAGAFFAHGGQAQIVFYAGVFFALSALQWLAQNVRRHGTRQTLGPALLLDLAVFLALGLSFYLYWPLVLDAPLTSRSGGLDLSQMKSEALGFRDLLTLLHPEILGSPLDGQAPEIWDSAAYINPPIVAMAGFAVWVPEIRKKCIGLLTLGGLSFLLAMQGPHQALMGALPGFSLFRHPVRFFFLTHFFVLIVAGHGLAGLRQVLTARSFPLARARIVVGALLALLVAEGAIYAHRYLRVVPHEAVFPKLPFLAQLKGEEPGRLAPIPRFTLNYGQAPSANLELITSSDPYNHRHARDLVRLISTEKEATVATVWNDLGALSRWDVLNVLNVRHVLSVSPLLSHAHRLKKLAHHPQGQHFYFYRGLVPGPWHLFENPTARRRAAREKVLASSLDAVAVVEAPAENAGAVANVVAKVGKISVVRDGLAFDATCTARCYVVISEIWHPGWRAQVQGMELSIHKTNLALMGLWLEPGEHRVILSFFPPGLKAGLAVGAGAVILWCVLWAFSRRGRRSTAVN
jgi:hypothetical protein